MGSTVVDKNSYIVSTDLGLMRNDVTKVKGYDIEDIIRDRAISQARAIVLLNLGKNIDPTKPTAPRTISTKWLNNDEELAV